jgi:hypothetical protein
MCYVIIINIALKIRARLPKTKNTYDYIPILYILKMHPNRRTLPAATLHDGY